jgi:large subunit ribosomal protein L4
MAVSKTKAVKKEEPKTVKKAVASLSAPVFDAKGAKAGTVALPKEVFGAKINMPLMAQAVRVYLANQRKGTLSTKTRGEVHGSTRKIYRQKGTGRARHGGVRAPIFVGGGVAFGPKPRDFSLSFPKKMKKAALLSALSLKAKDGEIKVLSGLMKIEPKTKNMDVIIKKVSGDKKNKQKVLLVTAGDLDNVKRAGRNIRNLEVSDAKLLSTYQVLKNKELYFMKESLDILGGAK